MTPYEYAIAIVLEYMPQNLAERKDYLNTCIYLVSKLYEKPKMVVAEDVGLFL